MPRYRILSITDERGSTYCHRKATLACIPDGSHWATRPQTLVWPIPADCNWQPDDIVNITAEKDR